MSQPRSALHGQTALLTGAADRLGRAIALALAGEGVNVLVHYHCSGAAADETAERARAAGVRAWTLPADLAQPDEAERLMDQALAAAGGVDILVNNASIFPAEGLLEFPPESLQRNVQIHAMAPLLLARRLAAQGRCGQIVNLLDARMVDYDRRHAAYHLSKRMLHALTRMLAVELAPSVRVNAVAPGLVLPPAGHDEGYLRRLAHTTLLNRHGSARDVTEAVLFLLRGDFITGQTIFVDGGRNLKGRMYD